MKVRDLVLLLAGFNPDADVILWNWFALPGTGAEFHLHPTLNQDKAGGVLRLSAEGGRVPGTGPQREVYLRVDHNNDDEIVGDVWMTSEEAAVANSWVIYYGDYFMTPQEWAKKTGRELPEEYE